MRALPNGLLRAVLNRIRQAGFSVGTDGDRSRYDAAYMLVYEKSGLMVKLSGTADVKFVSNAELSVFETFLIQKN